MSLIYTVVNKKNVTLFISQITVVKNRPSFIILLHIFLRIFVYVQRFIGNNLSKWFDLDTMT